MVAIYTGLDLPILALYADSSEVGNYRAAMTILHLAQPLLLTVSAVTFPLIAKMSALPNPDWSPILRWWRLSAMLGLGLIVLAPATSLVMAPVFGESFSAAGGAAPILLGAKGIALAATIPAISLVAMGKARLLALISCVATVVFLALSLTLTPIHGQIAAAGSVLAAEVVVAVLASLFFLRLTRKCQS